MISRMTTAISEENLDIRCKKIPFLPRFDKAVSVHKLGGALQ